MIATNVSASHLSVILTGLQGYANYSLVRTYTSIGPGPNSDVLVILTKEDSKSRNIS